MRFAGGRRPIEPGLGYGYGNGFVYSFTMDEVSDLARQAGYRVEFLDEQSFPYAVLVPCSES